LRHRVDLPALFLFGIVSAGCAARHEPASAPPAAPTAALAGLMEGRYSSAAQAARDPEYRDIRLSMTPIWRDRADGPWLFVEQAVAGQAPYRRRVYHLVARPGGVVESAVFTFPEGATAATLTPEDLIPRTGCSVFLERRTDGKFAGGTRGQDCSSDLRGASYATSEAVISSQAPSTQRWITHHQ